MSRGSRLAHTAAALLVATVVAASVSMSAPPPTAAVSSSIVISQVYGGGGNTGATLKNDFIELYNRGSVTVNVTGWTVQYASSKGTTWVSTTLSGTIAPAAHYLVQEGAGAGGTLSLPTPNATGAIAMSATAGKVALVGSSTLLSGSCPGGVVDRIGYGSGTNCAEGSVAPTLSNTQADLRKNGGATDTDNNAADFAVGAPNPRHSVVTDAAPTVKSTSPAAGTKNVALAANLSVTFSEAVTLTSPAFTLSCSLSGAHTVAVTGGPTTFTLNPATDFVDKDACSLVVLAAHVHDVDTIDPPDTMAANATVSFSVSKDQMGPTCTAPATSFQTGVALSGTSLRDGLSWSGADNVGGTGLARFELQKSVNSGTWTAVTSALVTSTSVVLASSGTVQFRVRGVDLVGNAGAWAYGPPLLPRLVEQNSTAITYTGTWASATGANYSGGAVKYATAAGASATYKFTGRAVTLVTTKAPTHGQVKVYVDGVYATTVDTYAATAAFEVQAWWKAWTASGTHTIKLVVVGTSGRPRVDLDAIGLLLPSPTGTMTGTPLALLALLPTASEYPTGYDRSLFRYPIDADGNGCDTRGEVLIAESLTPVKVGLACALSGGSWLSAYDGIKTTNPSDLEIDHVVALKEAWDSGAYSWTAARRQAYANDLGDYRTLRAVTTTVNVTKSDRDPAQWLPPLTSFRCTYVTEWVAIKVRWQLAVDPAERTAIQTVMKACPAPTVTVVAQ